MNLPRILLITGTDSGVGKTVVTAALAACLNRQDSVAVFKPAQTGVDPHAHGDAQEIVRLTGIAGVREAVRLAEPLAPTTAGRRADVQLPSVGDHAETVHALARSHQFVLVEGAGGLTVGLDNQGHGLIELAEHLEIEFAFVVVVRAGLGTLNHTKLTVDALGVRAMPCLGVVVGAWPDEPGLVERCNLVDLSITAGAPLIGVLPEAAGSLSPSDFTAASGAWFLGPLR